VIRLCHFIPVRKITSVLLILLKWNFIYRWRLKRRGLAHKVHSSTLNIFWVIPLFWKSWAGDTCVPWNIKFSLSWSQCSMSLKLRLWFDHLIYRVSQKTGTPHKMVSICRYICYIIYWLVLPYRQCNFTQLYKVSLSKSKWLFQNSIFTNIPQKSICTGFGWSTIVNATQLHDIYCR